MERSDFVLHAGLQLTEGPTYIREGNLLYSVFLFKCKSHAKALSQTYPGKCLAKYLGTLWPSQVDI